MTPSPAIKLPPGYTLDDADVKPPPGYSLDVPAGDVLEKPQKYAYTTPEGLPVFYSEKTNLPVSIGQKPVSIPLYNREGVMTPVQDTRPLTGWERAVTAPLRYEAAGATQLGRGLAGIGTAPTWEQRAGAASDIIRGGVQTATPFIAPGLLAAPKAVLLGLGTAAAVQTPTEWGLEKMGVPEGYRRLAGDLAGLYGGTKAYQAIAGLAKIPQIQEADTIAARLEATIEKLKDPSLGPADRRTLMAMTEAQLDSLRQAEGTRVIPALFPNPNEMEREAYKYMRGEVGMPASSAMATGSPFIAGTQKLTGHTLPGAIMDVGAKRQAIEALKARSERLVGEARPPEPSRGFYSEFERQVDATPAVQVPLSIAKDGSQITGAVKVPVDIRDLKYDMQPLLDKMEGIPVADRSTSWAYSTLKALLERSDDFISAPAAEFALGNFKRAARNEPGGISEAIAKTIIPKLQASIDGAVEGHAGNEALTALEAGRRAAAKEAGAEWLSDQFQKAQEAGGFEHLKVLFNNWNKLSQTEKRTMFNPKQTAELNNLFLGLKMLSENPNPSGTAFVAAISGQMAAAAGGGLINPMFWLSQLGTAGISKLLRSDVGVKLLTEGLKVPRNTERGRFLERKIRELDRQANMRPLSDFERN